DRGGRARFLWGLHWTKDRKEDSKMGFMGGLVSGFAKGAMSGKGDDDSGSKSTNRTKKSPLQSAGRKLVKKVWQKFKGGGGKMADSPIEGSDASSPASAKRGARNVRKTGKMLVHKGERVLTRSQAKRSRKRSRRSGGSRF